MREEQAAKAVADAKKKKEEEEAKRKASLKNGPASPLVVKVAFTGADEVAAAVQRFEKGKGSEYIVMDVTGPKYTEVNVVEEGDDCLTESWRGKWLDQNKVHIFVVNVTTQEDGYRTKTFHVFIAWVGNKIKPKGATNARFVFPHVLKLVNKHCPMSANIDVVRLPEEVTKDIVVCKAVGIQLSNIGTIKLVENKTSAKFSNFGKGSPQKLNYKNKQTIEAAVDKLLADPRDKVNRSLCWFRVGYVDGETSQLELQETKLAPNDLMQDIVPDMAKQLDSKQIQFLAFRMTDSPEDRPRDEKYARVRYGLMLWHGPGTAVMEKALSSHHWKTFSEMLNKRAMIVGGAFQPGYHLATKIDEVNTRQIMDSMGMIDHNPHFSKK